MELRFPRIFPLSAALALGPAATADVLVVDPGGAGDFTALADAAAAAQPGDTLLVRGGSHDGFTVAKGLTIVADGAIVQVTSEVEVVALPAAQSFVISGLQLLEGLAFTGCAGAVRVQECDVRSRVPHVWGADVDALRFQDCPNVAVEHCYLLGRDGQGATTDGANGAHGLGVRGVSRVALYDCALVGGVGEPDQGGLLGSCLDTYGGDGGAGARVVDGGELYAMDCSFFGGSGGPPCDTGGDWGDSGPGLDSLGGVSHLTQAQLIGGELPSPAPAWIGAVDFLETPRRELLAPALAREGQASTWTVIGRPGDVVHLPASLLPKWRYLPSTAGVQTLDLPLLEPLVPVGTIGASGSLDVPVVAPGLPAGVEDQLRHSMVFVLTDSGARVLGGFKAQAIVDASF